MKLELRGRPEPDPRGFLLHAVDTDRDEQDVRFILPEELAVKVLDFDIACGDLLERAVLDRLPEVWDACLHAYKTATRIEADFTAPVILIDWDFPQH